MRYHHEKPTDIATYVTWARQAHKIYFLDEPVQNYHRIATRDAATALTNSPFWTELVGSLDAWNSEFRSARHGNLFPQRRPPDLDTKTFDSMVDKSFRKNVLENEYWPKPPQNGWTFPNTWYGQFRDVLRTTIS